MRRAGKVKRAAVAVATAYVLALQIILTSFLATGMALAGPADSGPQFCFGQSTPDNSSDGGKPGVPIAHLACAVCHFASSAPPLPECAGIHVATVVELTVYAAVAPLPAVLHERHDPKTAQGPPLTA